jgi:hypothetical protein
MEGMEDTAVKAPVTMAIMDTGITVIPAATPWVAVVLSKRGIPHSEKPGFPENCGVRH